MSRWVGLREDIAAEFEQYEGCFDASSDMAGMRRHDYLTLNRATTDGSRPGQTPEQKKENRRALEVRRREYKATKEREYYARKKAAA